MPKRGDIRADGRVYVFTKQNGREYWATREEFLQTHGADWFERRKRMDENVQQRAIAKAAAAQRRAQR